MALEASPALTPQQLAAVEAALERAGLSSVARQRLYQREWRQAALAEGVGAWDDAEDAYARSPRSTRGATRA